MAEVSTKIFGIFIGVFLIIWIVGLIICQRNQLNTFNSIDPIVTPSNPDATPSNPNIIPINKIVNFDNNIVHGPQLYFPGMGNMYT